MEFPKFKLAFNKAGIDLLPHRPPFLFVDTLLSAEYLRKAGGSATDKLSADNARIASERDSLALQVKRLEGQLADARKQIDKLTAESTMHKRLLAKVGAEAEAGEGGTAAKKDASMKEALAELRALEAEDKRKRLRPTDAELLDDDDSTPGDRIKNSEDMKNLRIVLDREEREDADKPQTKKPATAAASSAASGKAFSGSAAINATVTIHPLGSRPGLP